MVKFLVTFPHMPEAKAEEMREQIDRVLARESYSLHLSVDILAASTGKPSRAEFETQVRVRFPGATCVAADRGLTVVVGDAGVAKAIQAQAEAAGLTASVNVAEPEEVVVRVFGFPRKKALADSKSGFETRTASDR
jgi:hypothetical protein